MKKNLYLSVVYALFLSVSIFSACTSDEVGPVIEEPGKYSEGVFIVNEGNMGASNGSISFYSTSTNEVSNDIFFTENNRPLGDVVQSFYIHNEEGYIVVNNSSKIEIVNPGSFVSRGSIEEGLLMPRFMVAKDGKALVSNWGEEAWASDESFIAVIDLTTHKVTKTFHTEAGPEGMVILDNGKVFVINTFTNYVTLIDFATEKVDKKVTLDKSPSAITVDKDNKVWVLCNGSWGGEDGLLYRLSSTGEIEAKLDLNLNTGGNLAMNADKDQLFFNSGANIYKQSITASTFSNSAYITVVDLTGGIYGLGVDDKDNIFVSDHNNYASDGDVFVFDAEGSLGNSFTVEIMPSGFVFR